LLSFPKTKNSRKISLAKVFITAWSKAGKGKVISVKIRDVFIKTNKDDIPISIDSLGPRRKGKTSAIPGLEFRGLI
jgi:hypothetical protein